MVVRGRCESGLHLNSIVGVALNVILAILVAAWFLVVRGWWWIVVHFRGFDGWVYCSSVVNQLLVDLLHPLDIILALLDVIHHWHGIISANDALCSSLNRLGRGPGFMDVLGGEVLKHGQVGSNKVTIGICLPAIPNRAITVEELLEEG